MLRTTVKHVGEYSIYVTENQTVLLLKWCRIIEIWVFCKENVYFQFAIPKCSHTVIKEVVFHWCRQSNPASYSAAILHGCFSGMSLMPVNFSSGSQIQDCCHKIDSTLSSCVQNLFRNEIFFCYWHAVIQIKYMYLVWTFFSLGSFYLPQICFLNTFFPWSFEILEICCYWVLPSIIVKQILSSKNLNHVELEMCQIVPCVCFFGDYRYVHFVISTNCI